MLYDYLKQLEGEKEAGLLQGTDCMTVKWTGGRHESRSVSLGSIGSAGVRGARRRQRQGAQSFPRRRTSGDLQHDGGADSLRRRHGSRRGQRRCRAAWAEQPAEVKADGRLLLLLRWPPRPLLIPLPSSSSPPPRLPVAWRSEPPLGSNRDARLGFWITSAPLHHSSPTDRRTEPQRSW